MLGAMIDVFAVSTAVPMVLAERDGSPIYSSIAKRPVPAGTRLWLSAGNLAGDAQADLRVHGGADKAVYLYPSEHLADWATELGQTFGPAPFGENLSTQGVIEADARIGDVWKWDEAVLQICQPRWPCYKLALHRARPDIQTRMRETGRTGWYLRVLEPGEVVAGSSIELARRDPAGLTISDAHHAMGDRRLADPDLIEALANHRALADEWRLPLQERLLRDR